MVQRLFAARMGNITTVDPCLGKGGEGSVFKIRESSDLVLKMYNKEIDEHKAKKLLAMVQTKSDALCNIAAWPVDVVMDAAGGRTTGFLMPVVADHESMHRLCGPKDRKKHFPNADWRFMIHAAINIAKALGKIHESGCIVGDLNESGVMIDRKDATVKFIDCDSFQIKRQSTIWHCEVGKVEYTPPELQSSALCGKKLSEVVRTADHDYFGLAVMIFQLLFLGNHPFQRMNMDSGGLGKAISNRMFAYDGHSGVEPPPHTMNVAYMPGQIMGMFHGALLARPTSQRPTAKCWIDALQLLKSSLKTCGINSRHTYYNGAAACPFCDIESRVPGMVVFIATATSTRNQIHIRNFIVQFLEPLYDQVANLKVIAPISLPSLQTPPPSQKAVDAAKRLADLYVANPKISARLFFVALSAFMILLTLGLGIPLSAIVAIGATLVLSSYWDKKIEVQREFTNAESNALKTYEGLKIRYDTIMSEYVAKKCALERQADIIKSLPVHHAQSTIEKDALHSFLRGIKIADAKDLRIPGQHYAKRDLQRDLVTNGIITAMDVAYDAIDRIHGFGPKRTQAVVDWRKKKERQFFSDKALCGKYTAQALKLADERLLRDLQSHYQKLQHDLKSVRSMCDNINNNQSFIQQLYQQTNAAHAELLQAKSDLNHVTAALYRK